MGKLVINLLKMSKLPKFVQLEVKRAPEVCQLDDSPSKQLSSLDQISKLAFPFSFGDSNYKFGFKVGGAESDSSTDLKVSKSGLKIMSRWWLPLTRNI